MWFFLAIFWGPSIRFSVHHSLRTQAIQRAQARCQREGAGDGQARDTNRRGSQGATIITETEGASYRFVTVTETDKRLFTLSSKSPQMSGTENRSKAPPGSARSGSLWNWVFILLKAPPPPMTARLVPLSMWVWPSSSRSSECSLQGLVVLRFPTLVKSFYSR